MTKLKKKWTLLDLIMKVRKPIPPPSKVFQDETKNVKKDRKDTKANLKKGKWEEC